MNQAWIDALIGGGIIGIAVSIMLLFNGRVTGISGIVSYSLTTDKKEFGWRWLFILGLFLGGLVFKLVKPEVFTGALETENWTVAVAGLIVGFGTVLGSGCTSGHGVCGISRLSIRSILATVTFISAGVFAVVILRMIGVVK